MFNVANLLQIFYYLTFFKKTIIILIFNTSLRFKSAIFQNLIVFNYFIKFIKKFSLKYIFTESQKLLQTLIILLSKN